ncbi:ABC transporter substrate-binding protein [Allochromatium vinosum]|uniref:Thiamine pyrimidine synthase n=1 Tax=Allochromatium vinosum (strain ATCC 17899 / DSM 180 / NBRC 103801 / NCIMB 10441 / D) TaxID=572477 RepID=D3RV85_ALLVD|nr:ABC transporter substrate-binding protein [Allochromatium vinosum]ADC63017.1 NMT1/THI5 like domain protein [Allochromatium vinosum DSM 180]
MVERWSWSGWGVLSDRLGRSARFWGLAALSLLIAPPIWAEDESESSAPAATRTPLRLMLAWQPQAQFAGYYVAQAHGFYREAGIEASLLSMGHARSPRAALETGEVDLAVLWLSTAIEARAEGVPLVNVAQLFQRSSVVLIARSSSNVHRLSDINGRRVGVWRNDPALPIEALLRTRGLEVKRVPQSQTVNLFLRGGVEAMSGMLYNEYHLLINAGLEPEALTVFRLSEYGIDFPEDGLYALEQTQREKSAAITAFVAATRRGWEQAFADPEGALDLVLQHQRAARVPANRIHQRWMLEQIHAVMGDPGEHGWDWRLHPEDVDRVGEALQHLEMIDAMPTDIERLGVQ